MTRPCFNVEQFGGSGVSILTWDYDIGVISVSGDTSVKSEAVTSYEAGPMADACIIQLILADISSCSDI